LVNLPTFHSSSSAFFLFHYLFPQYHLKSQHFSPKDNSFLFSECFPSSHTFLSILNKLYYNISSCAFLYFLSFADPFY
jgi:hypothetical protein